MKQIKISFQYHDSETGELTSAQRTVPYSLFQQVRDLDAFLGMHAKDLYEAVDAARREL